MSTKITLAERNAKFLEFYEKAQETEEWSNLKSHKKVRYLQDKFSKEENITIPIGTIYKLVRAKSAPVEKVEEK